MIKLIERLKDKKCRGCLLNTLILIGTTGVTGGSCINKGQQNYVILIGVIVLVLWVISNILNVDGTGKKQNGDNPELSKEP